MTSLSSEVGSATYTFDDLLNLSYSVVLPADLYVKNEDGTYTVGAAASGYAAFKDGNSAQVDNKLTVTTSTGVTAEPFKDVFKVRGDFSYKTTRRTLERYVAPVQYSTAPESMTNYVSQADSYKRRYD